APVRKWLAARAVACRDGEFVKNGDYESSEGCVALQHAHELQLMVRIQGLNRLVREQNRRAHGEGSREQRPGPLAAREAIDPAIREIERFALLERPTHRRGVVVPGALSESEVRHPAERDELR